MCDFKMDGAMRDDGKEMKGNKKKQKAIWRLSGVEEKAEKKMKQKGCRNGAGCVILQRLKDLVGEATRKDGPESDRSERDRETCLQFTAE